MYGYITPDKSKLFKKDFLLFRAFYCGICKTTAKYLGNVPRLTTNYDITFLNIFLHAYLNVIPEFKSQSCILNPIKRKEIAQPNSLLKDVMNLNILLAYHNLADKVIDKDGFKYNAAQNFLKKHYLKSKEDLPEIDDIIKEEYQNLLNLERQNISSLDQTSDCFGKMITRSAVFIIKKHNGDHENIYLKSFLYNIGKFVYFMDALDDLKDDYKHNKYNPFLAKFKNYNNREEFINKNKPDIEFAVNITINQAIENFNHLSIKEGRDLLSNIVYYGLRRKFSMVLNSTKKQHKEKI